MRLLYALFGSSKCPLQAVSSCSLLQVLILLLCLPFFMKKNTPSSSTELLHCVHCFFQDMNFYVGVLVHIFPAYIFYQCCKLSQTTMLVHLIQSQCSNWLTAATFLCSGDESALLCPNRHATETSRGIHCDVSSPRLMSHTETLPSTFPTRSSWGQSCTR